MRTNTCPDFSVCKTQPTETAKICGGACGPLPAASNSVVINARCSLRIAAGQRVIVVAGLPVHHYRAEDAVAEAYAMVFLVLGGVGLRRIPPIAAALRIT